MVATLDFFTPVVDAAYDYGAIAAANSMSDVYAMGGQPFLALNVAALPPDLPPEISAEILRGGAEKAREAGVVVAGGHTVQDKEPKYGMIVLGFVALDGIMSKAGARPGDVLLLSKPLGTGTLTTALKRGLADPTDLSEGVGWMKRLNREAALAAQAGKVRGATDITGYSLLGHAWEMASASSKAIGSPVGMRFHFNRMPFLRGAQRYASQWIFPGGSSDNRLYFGEHIHFSESLDEHLQMLLFDAQTSGGLLLSVPPDHLPAVMDKAAQLGQPLWQVGEVTAQAVIEVVD